RAGAPVRINRHGLRGPDRNFQKREGVQRILFLGDSIPFGLRVPYDDTFPNMVEVAMNQGSGATVECINAGIPGYSTWQEYLFFEREACRYEPDVVVLSFCLNDVLHTYTGLRFGDYGVDDPVPYIEENFIDYLTRRSAILRAGKSLYHRVAFGKTLKENAIYREGLDVAALFQKADYPEIRQAWIDVKHYIQKIADRCAREKAQFILALFPYIVPISATGIVVYSPRPIAEYAQQMEYPYIDVLPLIERDMEKQGIHRFRHYIQDACHPSAHGNRLAAEALVQLLLQPSLSDAADTRKNPPTHPGVY
ncbi:MAG: SGNH/GDSL hydrolase family protein, partial [bacterium]